MKIGTLSSFLSTWSSKMGGLNYRGTRFEILGGGPLGFCQICGGKVYRGSSNFGLNHLCRGGHQFFILFCLINNFIKNSPGRGPLLYPLYTVKLGYNEPLGTDQICSL